MAMMIKRATEILTLKATLFAREGQVELSLERFRQGANVLENIWSVSAADLGVTEDGFPPSPSPPSLPDTCGQALREAVDKATTDEGWREPLWLHLVKPYGMLGGLDWEALLTGVLDRPVFRLPDFLEPVRRHPETLTVALVCDLPSDEPVFDLPAAVNQLLAGFEQGFGYRPTTCHLFAPAFWRDHITAATQGHPDLIVHTEAEAPDMGWLGWVETQLAGLAIDWVQFLVPADATNLEPTLTFSQTPGVQENRLTSDYLTPSAVGQFLNRISAWGCGFANPQGLDPRLLRYFADAAAQSRAGPVLFQDLAAGGYGRDIGSRLECLFDRRPEHLTVPPNPGGFLYVQPERLGVQVVASANKSAPSPIVPEVATPAWAVAANTFVATARQDWGLGTALGSLSAPAALQDSDQWIANAVGGLQRSPSANTSVAAAQETLDALTSLTSEIMFRGDLS